MAHSLCKVRPPLPLLFQNFLNLDFFRAVEEGVRAYGESELLLANVLLLPPPIK